MKRYKIILILFFILSLIAIPVVLAGEIDALEQAYKDQYTKYNNEIKQLQKIIDAYGDCIKEKDLIDKEMTGLYGDYRSGKISKREALPKRIELTKKNLSVLTRALNVFNEAKGEHRSDISINEIKIDQEFSRKRIKELNDKRQELKIKILERKGTLPTWWLE